VRSLRPAIAHLTRGRRKLLLFLAAYGVYDSGRWLATGRVLRSIRVSREWPRPGAGGRRLPCCTKDHRRITGIW